MVGVKESGPPHVSKQWLGESKGKLVVRCFRYNKGSVLVSVECHEDHKTVTKMKLNWPPSVLGKLPDLEQWCLSASQQELVNLALNVKVHRHMA